MGDPLAIIWERGVLGEFLFMGPPYMRPPSGFPSLWDAEGFGGQFQVHNTQGKQPCSCPNQSIACACVMLKADSLVHARCIASENSRLDSTPLKRRSSPGLRIFRNRSPQGPTIRVLGGLGQHSTARVGCAHGDCKFAWPSWSLGANRIT